MKISSFHITALSFAVLAGVIVVGWHAFGPERTQGPEPVNVTLTVPAAPPATAGKTDADEISTSAVDLTKGATFTSADKDTAGRYDLSEIFDGKPNSYITLSGTESELNVLINFSGDAAREVTAISYAPPPGVPPERLATSVDVMVLPEVGAAAAGHPVYSFTLQTTPGVQTFAIPGRNAGKAVWLRVSGKPNPKGIAIGDFSVIREHVSP